MSKCNNPHCDAFPIYGCAPHECYWKKEGGFSNPLGTSTIDPLPDWPDNFLAEIDGDKPIQDQLSYGLCGIYVCPSCKDYDADPEVILTKDQVAARLSEAQS